MLGHHLIVELYDCNIDRLNDIQFVTQAFSKIATLVQSDILDIISHEFSPQGVTVLFLVSASHFTFHSWPEYGFASIDIFICSGIFDINACVQSLKEEFESSRESYTLFNRGLGFDNDHSSPSVVQSDLVSIHRSRPTTGCSRLG